MKTWSVITAVAFLCSLGGPAIADPDKDESGHGRHRYESYAGKEEYWDGNCKVERKWERNGDYKEKRKCKGHGNHYHSSEQPRIVINIPPWLSAKSDEPTNQPDREPSHANAPGLVRCNSAQVGRILGGILGGVLGHRVGGGSGKTAATIGGAIAGVFIGGEIGRRMDAEDQACVAQALEFAPPGQRLTWQDPESHEQYAVTPGPIEQRGETYCRPFTTEVQGEGRSQQNRSTACRSPDGTWVNFL